MTTTVYTVVLADGQTFLLEADFVQASSPIRCCFHEDDEELGCAPWQSTPYQVADACHSQTAAARLCAEYFATCDEDCIDVVSIYDPKQEQRP